ncbi:MAG: undecaprenyl-diphosphate phosphatase [Candidatus Omnitrophota bacterium]|nr:undecaprenyl-diphosphate phosphatase [Candidatus Omnitrophota bacterium]MBU1894619.1 undecaprenyl-diphosphate phosphatase [Candidatus Omnitrophota bacterium]
MTYIHVVLSGVVQGITEFLPVSSSGHLVFLHKFFGFTESSVFFDICLHVATMLAVILYFRKDIIELVRKKNSKYFLYIVLGTVPAGIAGLLFEEKITSVFSNYKLAAVMLILTGCVLFLAQVFLNRKNYITRDINGRFSVLIGVAQAFALFPGLSRSGMTISTALISGIKTEEAFRFSFLLSIPIISAAMLYKLLTIDISSLALSSGLLKYAVGMVTAFVFGFLSLNFLWRIIKSKTLFIFGIYCIVLGGSIVLF